MRTVGIFLNEGTGAKMEDCLDHEVSVDAVRCQGDRQVLGTELTVASDAPAGGRGLPDYVADSVTGVPRGTIRTTEDRPQTRREHGDRSLVVTTVDVRPGQTRTVTFRRVSGRARAGSRTCG